jgi:GAF domain-containing protein
MAAFAFENIDYSRYYVRLDSTVAEHETDYSLLLDAARDLTSADTAIIYALSPEETEVDAIAIRSGVHARLKDTGVTLSIGTSRWLDTLPSAVQGASRDDLNFEKFPETLQYQIQRLIVVPLRGAAGLLGILTLGRAVDSVFASDEIETANRAGRILAAVLERDSLRQKLTERKLIERAKGILQQKRRLSEEQAYLMLRTNSRRRRVPMVNLAKEVIEAHLASPPQRRFQTA